MKQNVMNSATLKVFLKNSYKSRHQLTTKWHILLMVHIIQVADVHQDVLGLQKLIKARIEKLSRPCDAPWHYEILFS